MRNQPLVSAIVPIYKVEDKLQRCVESILNQTYGNLEIILVDDGSPDRCPAICDEYAKRSVEGRHIVVIHQKNGGLSVARNSGCAVAKGKYCMFIDSDDWIELSMIETMVGHAEKNNLDLVKCSLVEIRNGVKDPEVFKEQKLYVGTKKGDLIDRCDGGILWTVVWNALYRTSIAKTLQSPPGLIHQDNYYSPRYIFECKRVMAIKDVFNNYEYNDTGISSKQSRRPLDRFQAMWLLRRDLEEQGFKNNKNLNRDVAHEIYNFICKENPLVRPRSIQKDFYKQILHDLNLRQAIRVLWNVHNKKIEIRDVI